MASSPVDTSGSAWPEIRATTLSDRVYQIVRNRILQRELAPGSFVREQEISDATGVSRTPVREALNRLASQEFLERVPHRGFRVPDNPWENLLEIYPIVTSLEMLAGSLALEKLTEEDMVRMRELNDEMVEAGKRGDEKAVADLNNAFHHVISERSGNERLCELLDQLRAQVYLLDTWYFSEPKRIAASADDHSRLIDAIQRGHKDDIMATLETNYGRGQTALEEEMKRDKPGAS